MSLKEISEIALPVLRHARQIALEARELEISVKANRNDLVTQVDREIENYVAKELIALTGYKMMGEESHSVEDFRGRVWVLDPIDGTMNYVATGRDYAISLALLEGGKPIWGCVVDVTKDLFYVAGLGQGASCNGEPIWEVDSERSFEDAIIITDIKEICAMPRLANALVHSRGHRRYGSAALEIVEVAAGRAGAFVHMWVSPWDIAAATLICEEAGASVTRLDGTRMDVCPKGSILAGWPNVHQGLLKELMINAQ
ncbi:MAG: inositol monophosphatase family protein [Winkia neuii]|uniref:inositol monophosphatase family protein n=1 Tax=Winkia neuii TaxID=33007 RepID=UPI002902B239|nr:inositol monophosphatase family protein [Winkia neuii]MDU3135006.1 inositol monophosphatase family protein [Winkia neuii]